MDSGKKVIGFVGLDELGLQMASSLLRHGYDVQAFKVLFFSLFFFIFAN
jgi:hypothetical protein